MISKAMLQAVETLKGDALSVEERNLLTTVLLERLGALPLRARLAVEHDQNGNPVRILFDEKPLDQKLEYRLSASARNLLRNYAYKFVREAVTFSAIKIGVHQNTSPEQGLFAKAALWDQHEVHMLLMMLAQLDGEPEGE